MPVSSRPPELSKSVKESAHGAFGDWSLLLRRRGTLVRFLGVIGGPGFIEDVRLDRLKLVGRKSGKGWHALIEAGAAENDSWKLGKGLR